MSYTNKPLIVWQKWIDPFFGSDYENTHETLDDMLEEPEFINDMEANNSEDETDDDISYEDKYDDNFKNKIKKEHIKAIITPMGIIPIEEYSASSKIFNFWVGHTNFSISKPIANIIETTDGIETLDIFTRYRFRIGIGKLFKSSDVMSSVVRNVSEFINEYDE